MAVECPWCGEPSVKDDFCEWCGRLIANPDPGPSSPPSYDDDEDLAIFFLAPLVIRMEYFLAACMLSLAAVVALAGTGIVGPSVAVSLASFFSCFWLSVYQIVPSVDDAWAPAGLAGVFSAVFGPVLVAAAFLIIWLFGRRPEAAGLLILVLVHLAAAGVAAFAARPDFVVASALAGWLPGTRDPNLTLFAGLAGWTLANFWRPLNEEIRR